MALIGTPYYAYNGEEYSPATGLYYLRARYYDPATAGFTTSDPSRGSVTSINSQGRYAYAGSDPVNNADPSGSWRKRLRYYAEAIRGRRTAMIVSKPQNA